MPGDAAKPTQDLTLREAAAWWEEYVGESISPAMLRDRVVQDRLKGYKDGRIWKVKAASLVALANKRLARRRIMAELGVAIVDLATRLDRELWHLAIEAYDDLIIASCDKDARVANFLRKQGFYGSSMYAGWVKQIRGKRDLATTEDALRAVNNHFKMVDEEERKAETERPAPSPARVSQPDPAPQPPVAPASARGPFPGQAAPQTVQPEPKCTDWTDPDNYDPDDPPPWVKKQPKPRPAAPKMSKPTEGQQKVDPILAFGEACKALAGMLFGILLLYFLISILFF